MGKVTHVVMVEGVVADLGGMWHLFKTHSENGGDPYGIECERADGLKVIASVGLHNQKGDGRTWLHVSVSHPLRVPSYAELTEVKRRFIGPDRKAVMIFPQEKFHVNIHETCLHLWAIVKGSEAIPEMAAIVETKEGHRFLSI